MLLLLLLLCLPLLPHACPPDWGIDARNCRYCRMEHSLTRTSWMRPSDRWLYGARPSVLWSLRQGVTMAMMLLKDPARVCHCPCTPGGAMGLRSLAWRATARLLCTAGREQLTDAGAPAGMHEWIIWAPSKCLSTGRPAVQSWVQVEHRPEEKCSDRSRKLQAASMPAMLAALQCSHAPMHRPGHGHVPIAGPKDRRRQPHSHTYPSRDTAAWGYQEHCREQRQRRTHLLEVEPAGLCEGDMVRSIVPVGRGKGAHAALEAADRISPAAGEPECSQALGEPYVLEQLHLALPTSVQQASQ